MTQARDYLTNLRAGLLAELAAVDAALASLEAVPCGSSSAGSVPPSPVRTYERKPVTGKRAALQKGRLERTANLAAEIERLIRADGPMGLTAIITATCEPQGLVSEVLREDGRFSKTGAGPAVKWHLAAPGSAASTAPAA